MTNRNQTDLAVFAVSFSSWLTLSDAKGAITTSKIKHAIKLKTSPARLAQLLQPSLAFCLWCAVIGRKLKQNANEGCNTCASLAGLVLSFISCFILLVIAP